MSGFRDKGYNMIVTMSDYEDRKEFIFIDARYPTIILSFGSKKYLNSSGVRWDNSSGCC